MKLEAFRVQNYKRVEDIGWVSCRDLTVLVGKNEAGKSAILRGLSKLNPSDGEEYDPLREFPRRRFTDEFDESDPAEVASARFSLTDDERAELAEISLLVADANTVEITKNYGRTFTVEFDPNPGSERMSAGEVKKVVTAALDTFAESVALDGHGEEFGPLKSELTDQLTRLADALPLPVKRATAESVEAFYSAVSAKVTEEWHRTALAGLLDVFRPLRDEARSRAALAKARNWAVENMPRFIYFDHYDVLDSAVHIPTFMNQLRDAPHAPRVRTTRALFHHVNLDPLQLHALNSDGTQSSQEDMRRRVDERAILTSSAGQAMTAKFSKWWLQRRHTFRYDLDGDFRPPGSKASWRTIGSSGPCAATAAR